MTKHFVLPDTQCKPGLTYEHLTAAGNYIVAKQPEVIVHLGDHFDLPSLSSYDKKGSKSFEGRRYKADIEAGKEGMEALLAPINDYNNQKRKNKEKQYKPRMIFLIGNHEQRLQRLIEDDPRLEGTVGYQDFGLEEYGWEVVDFLKPIEVDGISYCLEENHKVLTKDLKYISLKDIKVGDTLLAFEEYSSVLNEGRKYKESIVEEHGFDERELFEVVLENGDSFKTTSDHLWLARTYRTTTLKWVRTDELKVGSSQAVKCFPTWETLKTYDAGYLAGMFDGEGHLSKPNGKQGGIQLGLSQRKNKANVNIRRLLDDLNVKWKVSSVGGTNNDVDCFRILGASGEKLALIGKIRADRLIENLKINRLGRVQTMDNYNGTTVKSVTPIGKGKIVKIKTSTGTMIADGYAHHNCHYFYNPNTGKPYGGTVTTRLNNIGFSFTMGHQQGKDIAEKHLANGKTLRGLVCGSFYQHEEDYKGYQGNSHFRGCIMKHEVKDGNYCLMELSLEYLLNNWLDK